MLLARQAVLLRGVWELPCSVLGARKAAAGLWFGVRKGWAEGGALCEQRQALLLPSANRAVLRMAPAACLLWGMEAARTAQCLYPHLNWLMHSISKS